MIRLALVLALSGAAARAQEAGDMAGMDHAALDPGGAAAEMMAAMDGMMADMATTELVGQTDADFLLLMLAHHQSAIDMARVEVERGEVAPVRELAQRIIDAQEAEIEEMRRMLVEMNHAMP